jgi:hypothetical protein
MKKTNAWFWQWIGAWAIGAAIGLAAGESRASSLDLQGSWMSPCYTLSGRHLKKDLYIVSAQIYTTQSLYTDDGCIDLSVKLEQVQSYQSSASELVAGGTEVDLTAQRSFMTVFDAATVTTWNRAKFCGINDWDVGIPREVSGRDCGGHPTPKAGDKDFDLYLRDGYSRLWIGKRTTANDGSTPDKRPRELDRTVGFRQLSE